MSSAARVGAAGIALEREGQSLRVGWEALRSDAYGGVLDDVHSGTVLPYLAHLRQASGEIQELAAAAGRAETLLAS